jgi:hypothetical protein
VSVSRQGEATRATYDEDTKQLSFSAGDKLFVKGRGKLCLKPKGIALTHTGEKGNTLTEVTEAGKSFRIQPRFLSRWREASQ